MGAGMGPGVPESERATYFHERLVTGWYELLCCPSSMGCTVVKFKPRTADGKINPRGGEPEYKIKLRLSHSEHVPRYQLHMVQGGKTKQWIVGHMEKAETHFRAKPGEFMRIQVWKLSCNSMMMQTSKVNRKGLPCLGTAERARPIPSAADMKMMQITIATQAKLSEVTSSSSKAVGSRAPDSGDVVFDPDSVRWKQTIGVSDSSYKLRVENPKLQKEHKAIEDMSVMRITVGSRKVCVARKQRFAGALSSQAEQPYLGVQIKPAEDDKETDEDKDPLKGLLTVDGLLMLLLCLAWSEETMSPHVDMTQRFIKVMHANPAEWRRRHRAGLDDWETEDVRVRLKHLDFPVPLFNWKAEDQRAERMLRTERTNELGAPAPESAEPTSPVSPSGGAGLGSGSGADQDEDS